MQPQPQPLVRSASLTHFADVASQCHLDAHRLVADAGLPARCLAEPDLKIPARLVGRLLEDAAHLAREPAFAVRMVEQRRLSNLGPLALLVRDEPTLRSALEALVRHLHLHNEALTVSLEQLSNLVVIRTHLWSERGEPQTQATELVVGVTFRVLGIFMGASWRPRLVCFAHAAPARLAAHRRLFGPAVEFGHEFNGIVCNAGDLDARNPAADPVMARYSRRLLAQDLERGASGAAMAERVRQLVVLLLPHGHCRVETVARHLGVDRRTVARRLADEGHTFSGVVDGVRDDLVGRYLGARATARARPLSELSAMLGFSAPSAFARWHRQRFGVAASRRAAAMAPTASR